MTDYLAAIAQRSLSQLGEVQPTPASLINGTEKARPWSNFLEPSARAAFEESSELVVAAQPNEQEPVASHSSTKGPAAGVDYAISNGAPRLLSATDTLDRGSESTFDTQPAKLQTLSVEANEPATTLDERRARQSRGREPERTVLPAQYPSDAQVRFKARVLPFNEQPLRNEGEPGAERRDLSTPLLLAEDNQPPTGKLPLHNTTAVTEVANDKLLTSLSPDAPREMQVQPLVPWFEGQPPRSQAAPAAVSAAIESAPAETVVHVTIGRVEVRANMPSTAVRQEPQPRHRSQTLEEYLRGVQPGRPS